MPDTSIHDGSVAAEISHGTVQLLRDRIGRGPTKARTVISKDTVAIVLGDTLTEFFLLQPLPGRKNQAIAGAAEPAAG